MKGKILEIIYKDMWEGQYGTMYTFNIKLQTMNDLTFEGDVNAKTDVVNDLWYKVGDEVEFEHTESGNEYPDKLKIKKEGQENYSGKQKGNNRSFALSYAKDLAVARINTGGDIVFGSTKDILEQAEKFVQWLDS